MQHQYRQGSGLNVDQLHPTPFFSGGSTFVAQVLPSASSQGYSGVQQPRVNQPQSLPSIPSRSIPANPQYQESGNLQRQAAHEAASTVGREPPASDAAISANDNTSKVMTLVRSCEDPYTTFRFLDEYLMGAKNIAAFLIFVGDTIQSSTVLHPSAVTSVVAACERARGGFLTRPQAAIIMNSWTLWPLYFAWLKGFQSDATGSNVTTPMDNASPQDAETVRRNVIGHIVSRLADEGWSIKPEWRGEGLEGAEPSPAGLAGQRVIAQQQQQQQHHRTHGVLGSSTTRDQQPVPSRTRINNQFDQPDDNKQGVCEDDAPEGDMRFHASGHRPGSTLLRSRMHYVLGGHTRGKPSNRPVSGNKYSQDHRYDNPSQEYYDENYEERTDYSS